MTAHDLAFDDFQTDDVVNKRLQRRCPGAGAPFQRRLVLEAVCRPWHRFEALLVDGRAVHGAPAVGSVFDSPERSAHRDKDGRISLGQREVVILQLVGVREVSRLFLAGVTGCFDVLAQPHRQFLFELQQLPTIMIEIHGLTDPLA